MVVQQLNSFATTELQDLSGLILIPSYCMFCNIHLLWVFFQPLNMLADVF